AVDSIIASPTNRVRVIVAEASGCCANEVIAVATARPSPSAGPAQPMPVVRPAVTIEATAMKVPLSMGVLVRRAYPSGCRDVYRGKNAEDIGLNHARKQAQRGHDDRKQQRGDREQDG